MGHSARDVRTSHYYPQSIRKKCPLSLEEAKRVVKQFISDYNDRRLHSAIGYITPSDMLAGKQKAIHEVRDRKLEEAREDRAKIRAQKAAARYAKSTRPEDRAMGLEAESLPSNTCHLPMATMR
ncbi:MAG: integrase core domain-containing protein [Planctomycetes bacterium]|nr:integrase core domain-containing protein [Planctomycetota bacterium]